MKLSWDNFYWGVWRKFREWEPTYWLRTHTINRYHLVDCRSPQNDYKWGWCDVSSRILYASMNLLATFVETEFASVDWGSEEAGEANQKAGKEIKEIYHWWKVGRKEEHDAVDKYADDHKVYNENAISDLDERYMTEVKPGEPGYREKEKLYSWNPPEPSPEAKKNREIWGEMLDNLEVRDDEMLARLLKIRNYLWT